MIISVISEGQRSDRRIFEIFQINATSVAALRSSKYADNLTGIYLTNALKAAGATNVPFGYYSYGDPVNHRCFILNSTNGHGLGESTPPELKELIKTPTQWKDVKAALELK